MKATAKSLAERIKVVILSRHSWNPVRQHKKETMEENYRHSLDKENEAEVYIRLTKHESLLKAVSVQGFIYTEHRRLTLPSPCDGMRIVPSGREFEHSATFNKLNTEFKQHVSSFLTAYPEIVEKTREKLEKKGLWDRSLFPTYEEMKTKFRNDVRYMECPTNGAWEEFLNETAQLGQLELQERLVKAAKKLIEVCSGDGRLYSATLENLADICELAGDFNLLEDPIIAKAAQSLLPIAKDYSAELIRKNKGLRRSTAERASDILKTLNLS